MFKELSVFIDESGDFGEYKPHSPYYIISLVFHNQKQNLFEYIKQLDEKLNWIEDYSWVHVGPIVRGEETYNLIGIPVRRKILKTFTTFIKKCPITYKSFHIEKKHFKNDDDMVARLSRDLSSFLQENSIYFSSFDSIKVYYDNGQNEISRMLAGVFHALFTNVEFTKVIPSKYKLFQAADLFCYFTLIKLKLDSGILSENEIKFFGTKYALRKNYLKPLGKMGFEYTDN